jgi:DNA-binding response OmpR family regulator
MECSSPGAIGAAAEFAPQLLIIDPVMPGVSGVDVARQISDQTKCKVLLISAGALEPCFVDILKELRDQDCDCEAFSSPFEKEELFEHVRRRIRPEVK